MSGPGVIEVLEEPGARKVLEPFDEPRQAPVHDLDVLPPAALATEAEMDATAGHAGLAVTQCRQTVGSVDPHVGVIADPRLGQLKEADHDGQHLVAG